MTRSVVPFRAWHYGWLPAAAPGQERSILSDTILAQLEAQDSWTAAYDTSVVACAGTIQEWPGRYKAWAFMSHETGPHMLWLTRAVREKLKPLKGRIEFTVRADFNAGHTWAKLLGFEIEATFKQYGPQGESHIQYVRIQ